MKVLIIEFVWQVDKIINENIVDKYDLIISLDPESSYLLKRNSIKFLETDQIFEDENIIRNYEQLSINSLEICSLIDKELSKIDDNFKKLNWDIFNDFHYSIKITYDQLIFYSEVFSKLIDKYSLENITISENSILAFENKLLSSEISVLEMLFKTLDLDKKKIALSTMKFNNSINIKVKNNNIKSKLYNFVYFLKYYFELIFTSPEYLSIRCFEIDYFNKTYPKFNKKILNYKQNKIFIKKYDNTKKLLQNLFENNKFKNLMKNKNFDFSEIFEKLIVEISNDFSLIINEYKNNKNLLLKKKPKAIIFGSSNPFYLPNIYFRKIAKELNIPQVVWVHGGYGGTKSLMGNDILDFRFCKNHIFYGKHLSDYMNNLKYGLNRYKKFSWNKNYNFFKVGSPKMDYEFNNFKKIESLDKKKTIVFLTGPLTKRNTYYFGNLRDDNKYSFWRLNIKIVNILLKYQEKYNIIIKDYSDGQKRLWKKILFDTKGYNIKYISDKYNVAQIVKHSDLIVLPWFSTTFFQSLYSNSDIFLLEKELIDEFKDKKFTNEIYFYDNETIFLKELDNYLDKGMFNQKNKDYSREYFLNYSMLNKRDINLNKVLKDLVKIYN